MPDPRQSPPYPPQTQAPQRSCGTCTACCTVLRIQPTRTMDSQPFEKAAGAPCSFLCQTPEGSCSIYTKRPAVCQAFTCAWMEGVGAPNDRPNQLGVLLMRKHGKGDVHTQWPHGVATIVAVACEGDDPERKGAWHLILRISAVFPVLLQQGEDLLGLVCPNPSARRAIQGAIPSLPVLTTNPWASA